jgi:hypothetical protein
MIRSAFAKASARQVNGRYTLQLALLAFDRLGFRTLFVHEWNVVGRDDSRDVAEASA